MKTTSPVSRSAGKQTKLDLFTGPSETDYMGIENPFGIGAHHRRKNAVPEGYGFSRLEAQFGQPSSLRVASALSLLDPDCDDDTWKHRRLTPLVHAARRYPELAFDFLYIGSLWSSGELVMQPARYWNKPDPATGRTRREAFDTHWMATLKNPYLDTADAISTIYFDAEEVALAGRAVPQLSIEYDKLYHYHPEWRHVRSQSDCLTAR